MRLWMWALIEYDDVFIWKVILDTQRESVIQMHNRTT